MNGQFPQWDVPVGNHVSCIHQKKMLSSSPKMMNTATMTPCSHISRREWAIFSRHLAEERTKSSGRKTAWPNGKTRRDSLNCKDLKRMIHSGSIVLSFLVISTKTFAVSHIVSPCARSCMKYRSVLKLFHYQQGRVHKFIEGYFLKWFCLLTL